MSRIAYERWKPGEDAVRLVNIANDICAEMAAAGYQLTLRQLYYQFVARGYIPNSGRSYKTLGNVVSRARLAGFLDWYYIEDRTRNLQGLHHWPSPGDLISEQRHRFYVDHWQDQEYRVEVWVEKEALVSVIQRPAVANDVDFFACRGYVSQSELHTAAQRHRRYEREGQKVVVIHLGDHDPSGIDMTRDVQDRLWNFRANTEVRRIALTMEQVEEYEPPPNPAKLTDSRVGGYLAQYGDESWELDALAPAVIDNLVATTILEYITDQEAYDAREDEQEQGRELLGEVGDRWTEIADWLAEN